MFNQIFSIMLKNILKLEGVETLDKKEQKVLNGGHWRRRCIAILCAGGDFDECGNGCNCVDHICQSN